MAEMLASADSSESAPSLVPCETPFGILQMTRLLKACAEGSLERVVHALEHLESGGGDLEEALVESDDWAGSTALHWAAYSGNARVVAELIGRRASPEERNARDNALPLHLAARYNNTSTDALEVRTPSTTPTAVTL